MRSIRPTSGAVLAPRLTGLLLLSALTAAQAQTTPAPTTPAQPAAPAAQPTPVRAPVAGATSAATSRTASAVAISVSAVSKGQIVSCPAALKLTPQAVCLYAKSGVNTLRPLIRGKLGAQAIGEWKITGKSSTLLAADTAGGRVGAFVLLSSLSDTESLIAVDGATASAATQTRPATPAGVVKGEPYVLGRDLVGVVNVTALGGNRYRLNVGDTSLTVTTGVKSAQLSAGASSTGNVDLPLAPATDGRNLIFPLSGLRSLGCTVTPSGNVITVACGGASIGLRPIVF